MRSSAPVFLSCLLLVVSSAGAHAQSFTFGFKVGAPLTDFINTQPAPSFLPFSFGTVPSSYTNRYLVGPTVELDLPFRLGVEVDALYRHYRFDSFQGTSLSSSNPLFIAAISDYESTGAWEFPLLAKYRLPVPLVHPFVDAGIAWDTLQGFHQSVTFTVTGSPPGPVRAPPPFGQPAHSTIAGFVVGGGVDVHALFIHITPELRYTRWDKRHFIGTDDGFWSNQNQVEVMVGITF